jgi:hypothetical protein
LTIAPLPILHNFYFVPADNDTTNKKKVEIDDVILTNLNKATEELHISNSKEEKTGFKVIIFLHAPSV